MAVLDLYAYRTHVELRLNLTARSARLLNSAETV
jgi:hypothetical protein